MCWMRTIYSINELRRITISLCAIGIMGATYCDNVFIQYPTPWFVRPCGLRGLIPLIDFH